MLNFTNNNKGSKMFFTLLINFRNIFLISLIVSLIESIILDLFVKKITNKTPNRIIKKSSGIFDSELIPSVIIVINISISFFL